MNSKECVRRVIARQPTPYIPLGFYCVDYEIVEAVIGRPTFVRNKIGCQIAFWEGRRDEVVQSFKEDSVEFYRKIDCCDVISFKEASLVPPKTYDPPKVKRLADNLWEEDNGTIWRSSDLTNDISVVQWPESVRKAEPKVEDFNDPLEVPEPDPSVFEAFDFLIADLGDSRYIAGTSGGMTPIVELPGENGGLAAYCLMPEVVRAATQRTVERQKALDRWFIRPGQDGVLFEQDMATTRAPFLSPAMFRSFCFTAMKERVEHVREQGMQVILHNCGNNRTLMDQFIEAGIMCYQSLQTIPDMSLEVLKPSFGDRMVFWGGIPVETLLTGSPDDCRKEVRHAMESGAPGGGFILGPSHSIAKGVSYENFMAMLDEYVRLRDRV